MTPDQINSAIAEACGWGKPYCEGEAYRPLANAPSYTTNLDSMHEAWCSLQEYEHRRFREHLQRIVLRDGHICGPCHSVCNATALQRAEAFLRTLNKWID